jgi:hypothetical protein
MKTSRFIILRRELRFNSSRKNQPGKNRVKLIDRLFYDIVSRWSPPSASAAFMDSKRITKSRCGYKTEIVGAEQNNENP